MMTVIIGGSGSGKSAYAEDYLLQISDGDARYYLATMQVYGEEGRKKVERHRNMRREKGFSTIEQQTDIEEAVHEIKAPKESSVLLECISNLAANEMFLTDKQVEKEVVKEKILQGIKTLDRQVGNLVIVTNNVFEDGVLYDQSTMQYVKAMGAINQGLAEMADYVVEVVVGIPLLVKGGL